MKVPTYEENPNGFHQRYLVRKILADGTVAEPDPEAVYIVLRVDPQGDDPLWTKLCRRAIRFLAMQMRLEKHPSKLLAKDLADICDYLGPKDGQRGNLPEDYFEDDNEPPEALPC
jgi:hypothetical protein